MNRWPAVALLGPRQAGKTTLAQRIARRRAPAIVFDLERESDKAALANPGLLLPRYRDRLVVIDEVQHAPNCSSRCAPKSTRIAAPDAFCCWARPRRTC